MIPYDSSARRPLASTASATRSMAKYMSAKPVVPERIISASPSSAPQ